MKAIARKISSNNHVEWMAEIPTHPDYYVKWGVEYLRWPIVELLSIQWLTANDMSGKEIEGSLNGVDKLGPRFDVDKPLEYDLGLLLKWISLRVQLEKLYPQKITTVMAQDFEGAATLRDKEKEVVRELNNIQPLVPELIAKFQKYFQELQQPTL